MSTSIFIKIFSDCCFCLAFLCLVAVPHASNAPLLAAMLLCALAASIATVLYGKRRFVRSRLCCLLPLLSLFAAGDLIQFLIMLVPIIYTGVVIWWGMLFLDYYSYRQHVIRTSTILLIVYLLACIFATVFNYAYGREIVDSYTFLGFGAMHVLCGFFVLRRLRIGSDRVTRFRTFTVITASAAVLSAAWWAMDTYFSKVLHALEAGAVLIGKAGKILVFNLLWDDPRAKPVKTRPTQLPSTGTAAPAPPEQPAVPDADPPDFSDIVPEHTEPEYDFGGIDLTLPEPNVRLFLLVIIGLIVLLTLVLMVRSFRARSERVTERETIAPIKGSRRKSQQAPTLSNRAHVRQLYRTFLRQEIRRGMTLRPSDTSEDVLRKVHQNADPESAAALRKVYIQARYDQNHPVSHEQVEKAREALKHLQDDT